MDNGVLALSFGRPGIQIALSSDGRGERWDKIVTVVPPAARYSYCTFDVTSGKPGMVAISRDRLLVLYDVRGYAENPADPRLNTVFVREMTVRKNN